MEKSLEELVQMATGGDESALEEIVRSIQDRIYGLALRMLWHPADAEDATQEILVRIITNLGSFRGESAFTTWTYRVASNYLLTTRKRRAESHEVTFEEFGEQIDQGLSDETDQVAEEVEYNLLMAEMRIGCTHGMLLCLDRDHRMAYILGEIAELNGNEGSYILDVTPSTFRKRLSRARIRVRRFMQQKCGIANSDNPCRCSRRVNTAIQVGYVDTKNLLFARPESEDEAALLERVEELTELNRAATIFRSHPQYKAPDTFIEHLKDMIESKNLAILRE